jgi:hypothetical protein
MPLARAVGEELAPAPGVERITLVVLGELPPPDDPHALPGKAVVSLEAPQEAYQALAAGRLSPDAFLARHRPEMELTQAPPERALDEEPAAAGGGKP